MMIYFKGNKILAALLLSITCAGINAGGADAGQKTVAQVTSRTQDTDQIRKKCKDAVKMIMQAQPTSLAVDLGQDAIAMVAAIVVHCVSMGVVPVSINKTFKLDSKTGIRIGINTLLIPLYPIIRYFLNDRFGGKNSLDNGLDALTASDISPELLNSVKMDMTELEKKVKGLNSQKEYISLIAKLIIGLGVVLFLFILNFVFWKNINDLATNTNNTLICGENILTHLLEVVALAFMMYKHSSYGKSASRMKKLEKLKQLLGSAVVKESCANGNEQ